MNLCIRPFKRKELAREHWSTPGGCMGSSSCLQIGLTNLSYDPAHTDITTFHSILTQITFVCYMKCVLFLDNGMSHDLLDH